MENILAILLVATAVVAVVFLAKLVIRGRALRKKLEEERVAVAQAALERDRKLRERMRASRATDAITPAKVSSYRKEVASKQPTHFTSPTQSVQQSSSDDGFVTGMLTGMLIDSMTHKSGGSNPIDFPRAEESKPSWGLDDSDSRKSIESSMDTSSSWSSSSSSDSYSSSSDSGPSSDW